MSFSDHLYCTTSRTRAIAREIMRVLGPGGCYVGIEPNIFHPVVLWRHLFRFHRYNSANVYYLTDSQVRQAFQSDLFCVDINFLCALSATPQQTPLYLHG